MLGYRTPLILGHTYAGGEHPYVGQFAWTKHIIGRSFCRLLGADISEHPTVD